MGVLNVTPDSFSDGGTHFSSAAHPAPAIEHALRLLEAGAEIVNDVSAGRWDPAMPAAMAELKCGVVLMHMRGQPAEWRQLPPISGDDLLALVARELRAWSDCAMSAGVMREQIVLDPGFGFGKNFEENYPLLARLGELGALGFPLLAGTSRKGFIGRTLAHAG